MGSDKGSRSSLSPQANIRAASARRSTKPQLRGKGVVEPIAPRFFGKLAAPTNAHLSRILWKTVDYR